MLTQTKKTDKNRSARGFTIIEVMIVLAIAGLILLIVFLAVPALQRNSRNTSRKSDIGRIGSAVQTVISNNNGQITALAPSAADNTALQNEFGTLSYYTNTNVTLSGAATGVIQNGTTVDTVNVYTDAACNAMAAGGQGASTAGATTRSVAIVYSTETGGAADKLCTSE